MFELQTGTTLQQENNKIPSLYVEIMSNRATAKSSIRSVCQKQNNLFNDKYTTTHVMSKTATFFPHSK